MHVQDVGPQLFVAERVVPKDLLTVLLRDIVALGGARRGQRDRKDGRGESNKAHQFLRLCRNRCGAVDVG
jgi:hypothetical protein